MTLHPKYRTDIDGLRAIAVLAVVAFHAFPKVITGGFIGVDIFFVISGFLISTILYENLERNQFSFTEFYARRIRRIFPALIVVLATCFTLGWFVLLPDEYRQLGSHMAGGAGFVQNYVLWNEAGYFDNTADTKPLLHLWSLGIEEQFYIVWPVLLWLAYRLRTNLLALTILIGLISFGLNIYGVKDNGTATFYSPQTRFWELLVGAILAYLTLHRQSILVKWPILSASPVSSKTWANVRSTLGLLFLILGLVLINKGSLFPGWWALLPTIGAVLILSAGPTAWFNRVILSNKVLTWLGLISYPLYLWHWALLSFARIMESETPNAWIRLAIVLISIGLSALTYYLIEKPIRFGKHQKIKTIILVVLMSIVGFVGYNTYVRDGLGFRGGISQFDMTDNFNWYTTYADASCKILSPDSIDCKLSQDNSLPTIALLGDSHANMFFPGLSVDLKNVNENLIELGSGGCPPILDIYSGYKGQGDSCGDIMNKAIEFAIKTSSIKTVILAANWHLYVNGNRFDDAIEQRPKYVIKSSTPREIENNHDVFIRQFSKTLELLKKSKKQIYLIKQIPELNFDPKECLFDRRLIKYPKINCKISRADVQAYLSEYEYFLNQVIIKFDNVTIIDPINLFCDEEYCYASQDGNSLYRDRRHLSFFGSRWISSHLIARSLRP